MGVSSQPSLVPLSFEDSNKGPEVETMKAMMMMNKKSVKSRRRQGRIVMKRRARLMESSRRRAKKIERRVTKLKWLIPDGELVGLDGLFRKTAHYILTLQLRVRVMQIMVKVLTDSDQ
ncbi:hypothetical protein QN277_013940 [Acacia crassicarpa]|uniref:Transcription factor UPBEAT1 n=1 Tax=Acacia crassicarpa TaxID=499986 RepID=A0AAE1N4R8_9FABA|nr:hypothetical protein QN277_013940 [Acacia crassicarpa]